MAVAVSRKLLARGSGVEFGIVGCRSRLVGSQGKARWTSRLFAVGGIYRELEPSTGSILVNGRNVSAIPRKKIPFLRRTTGVVFQDFRLIPRKTVFENVNYLPRILGMPLKEQKRLAYDTLRRVSLAHRMNAFPPQLSAGEKQRVAIARALINDPEILVADEPTGNLDPDLSEEIFRFFLEIQRKGTTVVVATHERGIVERFGRRVLVLDQGRLVKDRGPVSELVATAAVPGDQAPVAAPRRI